MLYVSLYFPPANSPFYNDLVMTGLQELEDGIKRGNLLDTDLLLNGDFNARTGNLCDFIHSIESIPELNEFNYAVDGDVGLDRIACDSKTNKFGHELINFCKVFSCYIVNGRFGNCTGGEGFTFINQTGCSVIDYNVVSRNILDFVVNFKIQSNTESSHFPLTLSLRNTICNKQTREGKTDHTFYIY